MTIQEVSKVASGQRVLRADDLRELSPAQLMDLFRNGGAPATLAPLEGDPRGVGIGLHFWSQGLFDRMLRKRTKRPEFLWHGKSFRAKSDTEGWGFNRFGRGAVVGMFPFKTGLGNSVVDGKPCVIIDYNVPRNPWWERLTWDELREVSPGIFLGITTLRLFGRRPVTLWFAVDTTVPQKWEAA